MAPIIYGPTSWLRFPAELIRAMPAAAENPVRNSPAKPAREIQIDSRKIACFSQAEQEPHNIQLMHAVHETGQSRDNSPSNQNAGNPDAGSDSVQHACWEFQRGNNRQRKSQRSIRTAG